MVWRALFSLEAITEQLQWFSGTSVRNGACLGGNIVTASPISDLNPVFVALDAQFRLKSVERGERVVNASDFFQPGYRKVDIHPDEVLTSVVIPYNHENQYIEAYKQARRREDDIAIVNAGFNVSLDYSVRVRVRW
jgi:xanthine dehydrogenase/oxidase